MTDTVRAVLIGSGRVAEHYAGLLSASPIAGLDVVATCDPVPERAASIGGKLGARTFASFADALDGLDQRPDLAIVLTPSGRHHLDAHEALDAGCHVLVEKPIALRPADADALVARADELGLLCGAVFQNRYNPAVRALKAAKDAGRFGTIVTATIRLRWCRTQDYYEDGWHGTWAQDGGVINQQAIHHVDALQWVCGPIEAVVATTANRVNQLEAEDTLVAVLRFADGALGTMEATTGVRPRDVEASLSVLGDGGIVQVGGIALNEVQHWEFVTPEPGDADVPARSSQQVPTGYGLSHLPLLADLVERLRAGRTDAPISGADGTHAVRLVHALYASVERGGWVSLADQPVSERLGRTTKEDA